MAFSSNRNVSLSVLPRLQPALPTPGQPASPWRVVSNANSWQLANGLPQDLAAWAWAVQFEFLANNLPNKEVLIAVRGHQIKAVMSGTPLGQHVNGQGHLLVYYWGNGSEPAGWLDHEIGPQIR